MESEVKPVRRRLRGKQTPPISQPPAEEPVPLKKQPKSIRARMKPVYIPKPHESSIDPEKKEIIEKHISTTGQAIEASGIHGRRRGKLTQASK